MAFKPLKTNDLRAGIYVRLNYKWSEHPFLRNTFKISSIREIAIIHKHGLTDIEYDPERSDPEALKKLETHAPRNATDVKKILDMEISGEEKELQDKKDVRIKAFKRRRESINKTEKLYQKTLTEGRGMIKDINAGSDRGLEIADSIIESIITTLNGNSSQTSLINETENIDNNSISFMHALNVCILSMTIGNELGMKRNEMHMLGLGALLHDIGKLNIPAAVRLKKGKLTMAEISMMKMHPQYGKDMATKVAYFPKNSIDIIYQHHECLDGSGYPQGIKSTNILYMSRIVSAVNEYDNLTNDLTPGARNYTPTEVLGHFYKNRQKALSPEVIVSLINTMTVYPPGSIVRLNDGSIGMVIRINHKHRMKPMILVHEPEVAKEDAIIVDL
ncbi:MAG: DUF3391 domain-containing protein, partial [Nitrospira sp.]|nr:DUF3391 domain-containing protein [Nitrospira sp.]